MWRTPEGPRSYLVVQYSILLDTETGKDRPVGQPVSVSVRVCFTNAIVQFFTAAIKCTTHSACQCPETEVLPVISLWLLADRTYAEKFSPAGRFSLLAVIEKELAYESLSHQGLQVSKALLAWRYTYRVSLQGCVCVCAMCWNQAGGGGVELCRRELLWHTHTRYGEWASWVSGLLVTGPFPEQCVCVCVSTGR